MKTCPSCSFQIDDAKQQCPNCGETLPPTSSTQSTKPVVRPLHIGLHKGMFIVPAILTILLGGLALIPLAILISLTHSYVPVIFWLAIIVFFTGPLWLAFWMAYKNNYVEITPEQISVCTGYFTKTKTSLKLSSIQAVQLQEGIGRFFGYGSVIVRNPSGALVLQFLPNPQQVLQRLKLPK